MFCQKCGKKLNDDAKFCDRCGAKVVIENNNQDKPKETVKEGSVHKCPYCGEILPYDVIKCPSCGQEIRDRKTTQAVSDFYSAYNKEQDENKKIELLNIYPIPNNREDIIEFMIFASSNIDVKYYVSNNGKDSLTTAWISKLDQCYQKATILFKDKSDIDAVNNIYEKVRNEIKHCKMVRLTLIILGFISLIGSFVIVPFVDTKAESISILGMLDVILLISGIVLLVFGFKKKKTNKELEIEKQDKLSAQARKDKIRESKRNKNVIIIDDDDYDEDDK